VQVEALSRFFHLFRRFFQVVFARPLAAEETAEVAAALSPALLGLFTAQAPADQRHAHTVMRRVAAGPVDAEVIAAALVHDVGKAGIGLGPVRRSVATVCDALGLPMTARMRDYRNHGPIGAERLQAAGASRLAVDFARRHPDPDPGPHDPATWGLLLEADHT
jgi:hypothetical protein